MQFNESLKKFKFTFFKKGKAVETVDADIDGDAISELRKLGYTRDYFDCYIRYHKEIGNYEIFKTKWCDIALVSPWVY